MQEDNIEYGIEQLQSDHGHVMAAEKTAPKDAKYVTVNDILHKIITAKGPYEAKTLQYASKSGKWLNAVPTATYELCINAQEWRNAFRL